MGSFIPDSAASACRWEPARVECYSGYQEGESPRAVILGGIRFPVADILSRKRIRAEDTSQTFEVFECKLEAGWTLLLERSEDGSWRVLKNIYLPRVDQN